MNYNQGFSLLEMLIVISLIGIITAILIPSQKYLFQSSVAQTTGEQLFHAIQVARNEAILKGEPIVLCKAEEWHKGYFIKTHDKVIYSFPRIASEGVIHWRAFPSHRDDLEFLPTGFSKVENGTFWFCLKSKLNPLWAIFLNQAGRARMVYPDRDGRIYDSRQMLIKC